MEIVYWVMWALMCSFYLGVWLLTSGCERRFVADPHRYVPNCGAVVARSLRPAPRAAVAISDAFGRSAVPASVGGRS